MIIKNYEIQKIDLKKNKNFLLYGQNQGLKDEIIINVFKKKHKGSLYTYDESEILQNQDNFFNNILSRSFFENDKLIIISRATDKINNLIEEIIKKKLKI